MSTWADFDQIILAQATAVLGPDGDYTTHRVRSFLVADSIEPDRLELPAFYVVSGETTEQAGPFGDGSIHYEALYPYALAITVRQPSYDEARAAGQEMRERLLDLLTKTLFTALMQASGRETPQNYRLEGSAIDLTGPISDTWLATVQVRFILYTET